MIHRAKNLGGNRRLGRVGVAAMLASCCVTYAQAQSVAQLSLERLGDLSLEQLGSIEVTSVSRRPEGLLRAAASVFVITADDIRRSSARSLPEALRLAPNLHVARTSAGQWAISARGFNNGIGNKLLVLVDGRTIYSPLFSGVFWDAQDLMIEDIEQIEIISGPGGTLWGANAVNGVISVTTRPASATQGGLLALGAGDQNRQVAARYGGRLRGDGHYRFYALGIDRDNTNRANGSMLADAAQKHQFGARLDWGEARDGVTIQADAYRGGERPGTSEAPRLTGGNVLARWSRQHSDGSSWRLQGYYDHSRRDEPVAFRDEMDIFDVDWQHSPAPAGMHRVVWGAGHREARDRTQPSVLVRFVPQVRTLRWTNLFVQDEMALGEQVRLVLGAKVERNIYTGWEFLPSARLAWAPEDSQLAWASLSRAVRAPARLDREFFFPGNPPFFIVGGPDFVSEIAHVAEIGWRAQQTANLSYSATVFHHRYDRLRSGQPPPAVVQNMMEGSTSGLEAWGHWQAEPRWRLSAGMNLLRKNLRIKPGSLDPTGPSALGNDPRHQWMLRSSFAAAPRHEVDVGVRHVGVLPSPAVPAYTTVDVRWGWRITDDLELSMNVQNLFDRSHVEFGAAAAASQVRRAGWLKLSWRL